MNPPPKENSSNGSFIRNDTFRMMFLCLVVGVIAGVGAIAFYWMLEGAHYLFLEQLAGYHPPPPAGEVSILPESTVPFRRWVLLVLPALGGLVSGILVYAFAPEAAGHGTDAAIESYHLKGGAVRGVSIPIVKTIASAITIGTGGSAGREGPIAQIGSAMGSIMATRLGLSTAERRVLMSAGMAAGIGAIFHAPLAAAIFSAEILYKDMDLEHEVLVPSFISSIVAYSIFAVKYGWNPVFQTPDFVFEDPLQLLPYLALAGVVAAGAILYTRVFYSVHDGFSKLKVPNHIKPAMGGVIVGVIGFWVPGALGAGYGVIQDAFTSNIAISTLLLIALAKVMTTSFTVGSGGSGGVFGPALVIGGALGGVVGQIAQKWLPGMDIDPGAFVVVGMAGFFAGAANCPISTLIMVSEMTGNYHLLVPSMLVCIASYLLSRRATLYATQLQNRMESPSKMGNMMSAVLGKLTVKRSIELVHEGTEEKFVKLPENMNLRAIVHHLGESDQTSFPVIDPNGKLVGAVGWDDIRHVLSDEDTIAELVLAVDLARAPLTVTPRDTLLTAIRKMNRAHTTDLIIVDFDDPNVPVGTLNHNAVVRAYDQALFAGQT